MNVAADARKYVAESRWRLRLFDCIASEVRRIAGVLKEPQLSVQEGWSDETFRKRVTALDELLADLCLAEAIIGRWGTAAVRDSVMLGPKRLSDGAGEAGGNTGWLALQWYPALMLSYAGGIAAVATESYDLLLALMHARVVTFRAAMRRWSWRRRPASATSIPSAVIMATFWTNSTIDRTFGVLYPSKGNRAEGPEASTFS